MAVKVLIVDDMRKFLDLETSFLKRTDCTLFKALNGLEALRIAKAEHPDIIFLDLEMPVMNGVECCRFLKSDEGTKDIPIVIVTASEKEEECFKAGCSSYLRKPIDETIFLKEIQKYVMVIVRKDPRLYVSIPVKVTFKGSKTPGTALNISRSGILLESKEPFAIGSSLTVDFKLPESKNTIKSKAMLVRMLKGNAPECTNFGLNFSDISDKHQDMLDSYIKEQTEK